MLVVDPARVAEHEHGSTGIFVRAQCLDGGLGAADIAELTRESLIEWLASRDEPGKPNTAWRDAVVLMLLGHRAEVSDGA